MKKHVNENFNDFKMNEEKNAIDYITGFYKWLKVSAKLISLGNKLIKEKIIHKDFELAMNYPSTSEIENIKDDIKDLEDDIKYENDKDKKSKLQQQLVTTKEKLVNEKDELEQNKEQAKLKIKQQVEHIKTIETQMDNALDDKALWKEELKSLIPYYKAQANIKAKEYFFKKISSLKIASKEVDELKKQLAKDKINLEQTKKEIEKVKKEREEEEKNNKEIQKAKEIAQKKLDAESKEKKEN